MNVEIVGQVGPQAVMDGTTPTLRAGKTGELVVAELHGKYAEQTCRKNLFWATMSAGVIFPAPAATANNPMTLFNPAGSGKNLILVSFDMVVTTIPGTPLTGLYGLFVNSNTVAAAVTGTLITPTTGLIGASDSPSGKAFSTSTLPAAPTLLLPFASKATGEVAAAVPITGVAAFHIDFDGRVVLSQGTAITPQMTVADTTNASVLCCFCWEEVPA